MDSQSWSHWDLLSHLPDPVPSTGKSWSSFFKLCPDSDQFFLLRCNPPSNTWGSGDSSITFTFLLFLLYLAARARPCTSSAQSLTWLPPHLEKKLKSSSCYEAPPKMMTLTSPASSPAQPQLFSHLHCPTTLASLLLLEHSRQAPSSGLLHMLFPRPGTHPSDTHRAFFLSLSRSMSPLREALPPYLNKYFLAHSSSLPCTYQSTYHYQISHFTFNTYFVCVIACLPEWTSRGQKFVSVLYSDGFSAWNSTDLQNECPGVCVKGGGSHSQPCPASLWPLSPLSGYSFSLCLPHPLTLKGRPGQQAHPLGERFPAAGQTLLIYLHPR